MGTTYHPPVKRSVEIAGHKTSITLEPVFWEMLRERAQAEGVPINAVVAQIDADRLNAREPTGLASAIRQFLVIESRGGSTPESAPPPV
tara:strand:- start:860 stop:1126 length:267 start_codon:yes stop_codon:yes gene_type:complete